MAETYCVRTVSILFIVITLLHTQWILITALGSYTFHSLTLSLSLQIHIIFWAFQAPIFVFRANVDTEPSLENAAFGRNGPMFRNFTLVH